MDLKKQAEDESPLLKNAAGGQMAHKKKWPIPGYKTLLVCIMEPNIKLEHFSLDKQMVIQWANSWNTDTSMRVLVPRFELERDPKQANIRVLIQSGAFTINLSIILCL